VQGKITNLPITRLNIARSISATQSLYKSEAPRFGELFIYTMQGMCLCPFVVADA
jgi:hypothetical protein